MRVSTVDYLAPVRREIRDQYATPIDFGIPNPYGPRTHNWKGGPLNEGSLYHGPVYTRPSYNLPRIKNPLFGLGDETKQASEKTKMIFYGVGFFLVVGAAVLLTPKRGMR